VPIQTLAHMKAKRHMRSKGHRPMITHHTRKCSLSLFAPLAARGAIASETYHGLRFSECPETATATSLIHVENSRMSRAHTCKDVDAETVSAESLMGDSFVTVSIGRCAQQTRSCFWPSGPHIGARAALSLSRRDQIRGSKLTVP
jgi:hypothetical protein